MFLVLGIQKRAVSYASNKRESITLACQSAMSTRVSKRLWAQKALVVSLAICIGSVFADSTGSDSSSGSLFKLSLGELLAIQVVTAASGFEQNLEDAPASVTVVHAEEWQAMGATTLFEAINHLPGMHISFVQTGLSFEKPIIRGLSGTFGQQVLLLVDGLPFRSVREGGAPWAGFLPLVGFKRIEIIRGSGSAIYGADAVGGIINLVSYDVGEAPSTVMVSAGEFNSFELEASTAFAWGENQFQMAWSSRRSDGDRSRLITVDAQTLIDQAFGTQASLAPGPMENRYSVDTFRAAWHREDFTVRYLDWFDRDSGTGAGVAQALDPEGGVRMRTQFLEGNYDLSKHVYGDMNVRLAWHRLHSRVNTVLFPPGAAVLIDEDDNISFSSGNRVEFPSGVRGNPGSDNHAVSIQLNHVFDWRDQHKLRWAIGAERTDNHTFETKNFGPGVYDGISTVVGPELTDVSGSDDAYLTDVSRTNHFFALQDQWQIAEKWIATLGVRHDHYSDFGTTTNPRLGLVWHTNNKMSFKAFAGTAFRAPSFLDLHAQNNPAGLGNPNLQPESVQMLDVGLSANFIIAEALQLETSMFRYSADKLITFMPRIPFDSESNRVLEAQNSGEFKVRGIEQQVSWRSGDRFTTDFNFTWLDPYRAHGVDTSAVPEKMANLTLHYTLEKFHAFVGGKWVMQRQRAAADTREDIDDYVWLNARVEYKFGSWQASVLVENLLDQDAREPSSGTPLMDYPLPGRQLSVQLQHTF